MGWLKKIPLQSGLCFVWRDVEIFNCKAGVSLVTFLLFPLLLTEFHGWFSSAIFNQYCYFGMHPPHIHQMNQNTRSPTWKEVFLYNPNSTCSKRVIKPSLKSGLAMGPDLPQVMFTLQAAEPTGYRPSNRPTWHVHEGIHWVTVLVRSLQGCCSFFCG